MGETQLDNVVENKVDHVKRYNLLLHNDDVNTFEHVIATLCELFRFTSEVATKMAFEVHTKGICLVKGGLSQEHAEFYRDQLISKSLVSSIEPE